MNVTFLATEMLFAVGFSVCIESLQSVATVGPEVVVGSDESLGM